MADQAERGWKDYQPTKGTLVWSFFAGIVATLIVGFVAFGWYTAGGALNLADNAAERARAELASAICVERFMSGSEVAARLAELKEESTWSREDYIEEGGWITFARFKEPLNDAADLCAEALVDMKAPASGETAETSG